MTVLIIDSSNSGAAGDMLIAALLDICSEKQRNQFCDTFTSSLIKHDPQFQLQWKNVTIEGFSGIQLVTNAKKRFSPSELNTILHDSSNTLLKKEISIQRAIQALNHLKKAEMKVHGIEKEDHKLHFHELATIDTILDIIGFYFLLELLEVEISSVNLLPIAIGGGNKIISHGLVSVPTPATSEIIRRGELPIQGGPVNGELLTPTGAAILASLQAISIQYLPSMTVKKIGRSFGTIPPENGQQPFLRILLGTEKSLLHTEEIVTLETNVDDVDGETIGYLFDILFRKDLVLDFIVIHTIMKKNRPGYLLQAIVEPRKVQEVSLLLMRELGTLGVRALSGFRHIIPRNYTTQKFNVGEGMNEVKVKRGYFGDEMITEKVEYEDLKRIALEQEKPLRKVRKDITSDIIKESETNE